MALRFRLFYRGPLPSGAGLTKTEFKQQLRGLLHSQIKAAWDGERLFQNRIPVAPDDVKGDHHRLPILQTVGGHRFVPLASSALSCLVDVECLLLTAEPDGAIVNVSGDIDNRIKTLIDALRVPTPDEVTRVPPTSLPDPCYCLMDDDKILRRLSVTADRLLAATSDVDAIVVAEIAIRSTNRASGNPYSYV